MLHTCRGQLDALDAISSAMATCGKKRYLLCLSSERINRKMGSKPDCTNEKIWHDRGWTHVCGHPGRKLGKSRQ